MISCADQAAQHCLGGASGPAAMLSPQDLAGCATWGACASVHVPLVMRHDGAGVEAGVRVLRRKKLVCTCRHRLRLCAALLHAGCSGAWGHAAGPTQQVSTCGMALLRAAHHTSLLHRIAAGQ